MSGIDIIKEDNQRFSVLSYNQVKKLNKVMNNVIPIHGRGNFPTIEVKLRRLVDVVREQLKVESVEVRDIRLNGGAASYVLSSDASLPYNDLDLIFAVDLSNAKNYENIKSAVMSSLMKLLPEGVSTKRMSTCSVKEAYVHKMVKVNEADKWSLISLSNTRGLNVELKFVDSMRRQYEFSVDSFQIVLDSLLLFYDCVKSTSKDEIKDDEDASKMSISESFYPTVMGVSVFGNFKEALTHLQKRLISTKNPEQIRGGGLLKYCNLLVRGYAASNPEKIKSLERYMCSRFFIDFSNINQQQKKIENYLWDHFHEESLKYDYLRVLHNVITESTVCLMSHELRQTLGLIESLAYQLSYQNQLADTSSSTMCPQTYIYSNGCFYPTALIPVLQTIQPSC